MPKTDTDEPMRRKLRNDSELPNSLAPKTDKAELNRE